MRTISFSDPYGLTLAVKSGNKTMTRRTTKYEVGQELGVSERYSDIYNQIEDEEGLAAAIDFAQRVLAAHGKDTRDASKAASLAGWNNKMYVKADLMPTHIVITDRKEQHIQDITDEECLLEGIRSERMPKGYQPTAYTFYGSTEGRDQEQVYYESPTLAFAALINRLSKRIDGKPFWDANPEVYAYTFKVVDDER